MEIVAEDSFEGGLTKERITGETVRATLARLGERWEPAHWKNCTVPPTTCGGGLAPRWFLLAAERHLTAAQIAEIVRSSEETVRRGLKRYLAEGVDGLREGDGQEDAQKGDLKPWVE